MEKGINMEYFDHAQERHRRPTDTSGASKEQEMMKYRGDKEVSGG